MKIASRVAICHMGSVLTEYVGVNLGQEIDRCRVDRWAVVSWYDHGNTTSEKSRLDLLLFLLTK